mmetsp:Transcript_94884/g.251962  ORF Transcript_94884/g.251962 Transcript_94884/m.251962 type:complete len:241 (+) Transcript_94884:152-874(+)
MRSQKGPCARLPLIAPVDLAQHLPQQNGPYWGSEWIRNQQCVFAHRGRDPCTCQASGGGATLAGPAASKCVSARGTAPEDLWSISRNSFSPRPASSTACRPPGRSTSSRHSSGLLGGDRATISALTRTRGVGSASGTSIRSSVGCSSRVMRASCCCSCFQEWRFQPSQSHSLRSQRLLSQSSRRHLRSSRHFSSRQPSLHLSSGLLCLPPLPRLWLQEDPPPLPLFQRTSSSGSSSAPPS